MLFIKCAAYHHRNQGLLISKTGNKYDIEETFTCGLNHPTIVTSFVLISSDIEFAHQDRLPPSIPPLLKEYHFHIFPLFSEKAFQDGTSVLLFLLKSLTQIPSIVSMSQYPTSPMFG